MSWSPERTWWPMCPDSTGASVWGSSVPESPPGRTTRRPAWRGPREELAFRIGPTVLDGAGDIHRARGYQRNQFVLVDGQSRLVARIPVEVPAKPMREKAVDPGYGFAVTTPRQRRAAASRVVRHGHGEARIDGCGPKGRFAVPRMPDDRHAGGIDILVGFEVVHRTAQAPGPGCDRAPFIGGRFGLPLAVKSG